MRNHSPPLGLPGLRRAANWAGERRESFRLRKVRLKEPQRQPAPCNYRNREIRDLLGVAWQPALPPPSTTWHCREREAHKAVPRKRGKIEIFPLLETRIARIAPVRVRSLAPPSLLASHSTSTFPRRFARKWPSFSFSFSRGWLVAT